MGRHGTIAGRKEKQDSRRSAIFTKYARAITVAAKNGGDPDYNSALKMAIDKAKSINMPNDNINRAVKKGCGELDGEDYVELNFEGYGPAGVAIIVETLTDNRNRTTSFVRSTFDKHGGNLGTPGCVSYMFNRKGVLILEKKESIDEDVLMEDALEGGMEDMIVHEDSYEIQCAVEDFLNLVNYLKEKSYDLVESEIEYLASVEANPEEEHDIKQLRKLLDILEDNDDVQNVHSNCGIDLEQ